MRVAVIGGGIYGQIIAWRLALAGAHVSIVEPIGPGHGKSASGDRTRVVRAFYARPEYALAGHLSLERWAAYGVSLGVALVERTGVLYFDRKGTGGDVERFRAEIDGGIGALAEVGAECEVLSPSDVAKRFPAVATSDLHRAVFEPGGGFGRPATACRAIARAALETGRVTAIPACATGVATRSGRTIGVSIRGPAVDATHEFVEADRVIVAAGAAGAALVEPFLPGPLPIRQLPHFTSTWDVPFPDGAHLNYRSLPVWIDLGAGLYGIPDDGENGFKVAWHEPIKGIGPRAERNSGEVEDLRSAAALRFPAMRRATLRALYACAYDSTPDESFLVGPIPAADGLFFVGGLSGHGYKHAPAIGEAVAANVLGDAPALNLSSYRLV